MYWRLARQTSVPSPLHWDEGDGPLHCADGDGRWQQHCRHCRPRQPFARRGSCVRPKTCAPTAPTASRTGAWHAASPAPLSPDPPLPCVRRCLPSLSSQDGARSTNPIRLFHLEFVLSSSPAPVPAKAPGGQDAEPDPTRWFKLRCNVRPRGGELEENTAPRWAAQTGGWWWCHIMRQRVLSLSCAMLVRPVQPPLFHGVLLPQLAGDD